MRYFSAYYLYFTTTMPIKIKTAITYIYVYILSITGTKQYMKCSVTSES